MLMVCSVLGAVSVDFIATSYNFHHRFGQCVNGALAQRLGQIKSPRLVWGFLLYFFCLWLFSAHFQRGLPELVDAVNAHFESLPLGFNLLEQLGNFTANGCLGLFFVLVHFTPHCWLCLLFY